MRYKLLYLSLGFILCVVFFGWMFFPFEDAEVTPIPMPSDCADCDDGYLESVQEFGPLKMGERTPYGEGQSAPLDGKDIPKAEFYFYVQRRGLSLCEFESCSVTEGKVVQCMGGWLSGDGHSEVSDYVGLDSKEVSEGKASIVVVADKNSKIIGIYPNHTEGDILEILGQYPKYKESFKRCLEEEIGPRY